MQKAIIEQAPKIILLSDPKDFWIQLLSTIVTFFAVIVALFQEKIKDYFNQTELRLDINLTPPDCHQIDLTDQQNGTFISKCIYTRIRVQNISKKTANNIEIMASNLWKLDKDNKSTKIKTFLPMNLRWSHLHPTKEIIPPKSFRFCDLGPFRPLNGKAYFKLDTIVQPNPVSGGKWPNILEPGKYLLELLMSGDNVKPKIEKWIIEFTDYWSDNEEDMLRRISILKQ